MKDSTSTAYTLIPYLYRDASNYKEHDVLVADGKISRQQIEAMQAVLWEEDGFIPTQLGLTHLGERMSGFPGDDDHCWHEIDLETIETGTGEANTDGTHVGDITAFVNRFVAEGTKGWDDSQVPAAS